MTENDERQKAEAGSGKHQGDLWLMKRGLYWKS